MEIISSLWLVNYFIHFIVIKNLDSKEADNQK